MQTLQCQRLALGTCTTTQDLLSFQKESIYVLNIYFCLMDNFSNQPLVKIALLLFVEEVFGAFQVELQ